MNIFTIVSRNLFVPDIARTYYNETEAFMEVYNKNRDKNQSLSDEIKEQNAKLKMHL